MQKSCLECGEKLVGRSDKKYCSSYCRSTFNNRRNGGEVQLIREINQVLKKNRKILHALNPKGKTKIKRDRLTALQYDFRYHTNTFTTKQGKTYFFCYDQGYVELEEGYLALVERQDYVV